MILGGAEVTMWDVAGMYASMARILDHYYLYERKYSESDIDPPEIMKISPEKPAFMSRPILSAGAIYLTYEALLEVNRPEQESGWEYFSSSRRIAWKTGTSFGFRDGWAVGTTPEYVVAVWTGNADGEGRPGLTGTGCAAPILFEIFSLLPQTSWFEPPYDELETTAVCRKSGHLPGPDCPETDSVVVLLKGLNTPPCPYHILVHLDRSGKYRVNADCESITGMITEPFFVLPPVMEWYYKSGDPTYKELPPFRSDCLSPDKIDMVRFIYPEDNSRIFIPNELDGSPGMVIFEVAHRNPGSVLFWHLDQEYVGTTQYTHKMALRPDKGKHVVRVVDEQGNEDGVEFWVESRK
jgi:penicillin-binding protein 1C